MLYLTYILLKIDFHHIFNSKTGMGIWEGLQRRLVNKKNDETLDKFQDYKQFIIIETSKVQAQQKMMKTQAQAR